MATKKRPAATKKPAAGAVSDNTEARVPVVAGWSVARIELAKRRADGGDLSLAAELWERVLGDERALGPVQALAGIAGVDVNFESAEDRDDDGNDPIVQALSEDWWRFAPEEIQGEIIRWAAGLGVALVHIEGWEVGETGRLLPTLDVWHGRALVWDSERASWRARTKANPTGVLIEAGDSEWLLATPYGPKRPWATAPWYGLGLLWFAAQCAKIHWASWNDAHAAPIRAASNDRAETHGLLDDESQQQLANKIKSLVRGGSLVLPDGYGLKLLEAESKNWESFFKLCNEVWPKAVAIALTGTNLTTQIEGGSFAASKTAENVEQGRKRTIARCLETTFRSQLIVWWTEFNFASAAAPWPHYEIDPPRDLQAAATRFAAGSTGLKTLTDAGFEPEPGQDDELAALVGLRVQKSQQAPAAAKPPPPAAQVKARMLASSAAVEMRAGAADEDGQSYVDKLVDAAVEASREVLAVDVAALLELIDAVPDDAADPAEALRSLRRVVLHHYGTRMSPMALVELTERVEVLAALVGRHSIVAGL